MKSIEILKNIIKDQRGYGVSELLVIIALVTVIAAGILNTIVPAITDANVKMEDSITKIGGSGT